MIEPRKPIFLGCEGESEVAYGQLLYDFARQSGQHIHLEVVGLIPGAGDPLARVARARQEIARRTARRSRFIAKFILMDFDQVATHGLNANEIQSLAAREGIQIIWQKPCHEGFLLRHIITESNKLPASSQLALLHLRQHWASYKKPMTRVQLGKLVTVNQVLAAAKHNADLSALLLEIGLLP